MLTTTSKTSPACAKTSAGAEYALRGLREKIEKNCDYVGPSFAEEARKIHYGETDPRSIYGETSNEDAEALKEEGVSFGRVPCAPRNWPLICAAPAWRSTS